MEALKLFTYEDYHNLDDEKRYEVFYGKIFAMSPAPLTKHQRILSIINSAFEFHLKGKKCKVFPAPFDVRFIDFDENGNRLDSVLQPDISIICDKNKIDKQGCLGAPDLVIEITSPSSAKRDLQEKFEIYQHYGVREYWIINPSDENVLVFKLNDKFVYGMPDRYANKDIINVGILPELTIDLSEVFEHDLED